MLHTDLGHSTVSGPPHVLFMMGVTAVCGLAVWWYAGGAVAA